MAEKIDFPPLLGEALKSLAEESRPGEPDLDAVFKAAAPVRRPRALFRMAAGAAAGMAAGLAIGFLAGSRLSAGIPAGGAAATLLDSWVEASPRTEAYAALSVGRPALGEELSGYIFELWQPGDLGAIPAPRLYPDQ